MNKAFLTMYMVVFYFLTHLPKLYLNLLFMYLCFLNTYLRFYLPEFLGVIFIFCFILRYSKCWWGARCCVQIARLLSFGLLLLLFHLSNDEFLAAGTKEGVSRTWFGLVWTCWTHLMTWGTEPWGATRRHSWKLRLEMNNFPIKAKP